MKVTITAEIPDGVPTATHVIHYLMLDALKEFCAKRKDVWEYVRLRYPEGYLGNHANDARKIAQVKNRIILAQALQDNIITLHAEREDDNADRERNLRLGEQQRA